MSKIKYNYILAFGSNLGDRFFNLSQALAELNSHVVVLAQSKWHKTQPLLHPIYNTADHEYYINFVANIETNLNPSALYKLIATIEDAIGHPRTRRWMPRALDIDVLFCAIADDQPFSNLKPYPYFSPPDFYIPHREYFNRDFWQDMVENELKVTKECLIRHFEQGN